MKLLHGLTVAFFPFALVLGSCADLTVQKVADDRAQHPLIGRLVYNLPRTAITAVVTLDLNACEVVADTEKDTSLPGGGKVKGLKYNIDIDENVVPTTATEADPDYRFAISYEDARTWLKEINFTVATNNNGTLQSFNGTINDQAGPDAIAGLTAAIKIAGAAFLPGLSAVDLRAEVKGKPAAGPKKIGKITDLCRSDVLDAFKEIADTKTKIDAVKAEKISKEYPLAKQDAEVAALQAKITDTKKKKLERTFYLRWLPQAAGTIPATDETVAFQIDTQALIKAWLTPDAIYWLNGEFDKVMGGKATAEQKEFMAHEWSAVWENTTIDVKLELTIDNRTRGLSTAYALPGGTDESDSLSSRDEREFAFKKLKGLVVRQPATAYLRVCKGQCAPTVSEMQETTTDVVARQQVLLPQYGQIRVFPERSVLFENATLVVTVNSDGSIASAGDHSISSLATGLAGVATAADAISSAEKDRNSAIKDENDAKSTKAQWADTMNKALADCITQQAVIVAAGGKPVPCQ